MLHTFKNYAFRASEIDTPIEDQKLDGHFVERIRGSSRESSIGVVKNGWAPSDSPSMGPLKTARTPTAATLFGEIDSFKIDLLYNRSGELLKIKRFEKKYKNTLK